MRGTAYHEIMLRIKICGITNTKDALAASRAGADAIGLNFFCESKRFVQPEVAREIAAQLPAGVSKVGVFVNHDAAEIAAIVDHVGLDSVQLHGDERPELLAQLPDRVRIVRAHRCGQEGLSTLPRFLSECGTAGRSPDAVLVDADAQAAYGGTGRIADWVRIEAERESLGGLPLILAGGLTPDNVNAAIAAVRPDGVDVASGVERRPGIKDHELLKRFLEAARRAFAGS